jgi:hypothetical protein
MNEPLLSLVRQSTLYRFCRAGRCAGAAIGAFAGVNRVDGIAFADRFNRALGNACSARNARIRDNMRHCILLKLGEKILVLPLKLFHPVKTVK